MRARLHEISQGFARGTLTSSFLYHYARLIEIIAGLKRVERCMEGAEFSSADASINHLCSVRRPQGPARRLPLPGIVSQRQGRRSCQ